MLELAVQKLFKSKLFLIRIMNLSGFRTWNERNMPISLSGQLNTSMHTQNSSLLMNNNEKIRERGILNHINSSKYSCNREQALWYARHALRFSSQSLNNHNAQSFPSLSLLPFFHCFHDDDDDDEFALSFLLEGLGKSSTFSRTSKTFLCPYSPPRRRRHCTETTGAVCLTMRSLAVPRLPRTRRTCRPRSVCDRRLGLAPKPSYHFQTYISTSDHPLEYDLSFSFSFFFSLLKTWMCQCGIEGMLSLEMKSHNGSLYLLLLLLLNLFLHLEEW